MIRNRKQLARMALEAAVRSRSEARKSVTEPMCVHDFVESQGIEVRFENASSMEGLYSKDPGPLILIGSERPAGRQAFTCAHEFGHHVFEHGTRVDELHSTSGEDDPDEFLVNVFASYLLMPRLAVARCFTERGWSPSAATAEQAFVVAGVMGVGYGTLVHHLRRGVGLMSSDHADGLLDVSPKEIRRRMLQFDHPGDLVVADHRWTSRPVDLQCGDLLRIPADAVVIGPPLVELLESGASGKLFEARAPGIAQLLDSKTGWTSFLRVSRKQYVGLSQYRHLEDC